MDLLKLEEGTAVLAVCEDNSKPDIEEFLKNTAKKVILTADQLSDIKEGSNDLVVIELPEEKITDSLLQKIFKSSKSGSRLLLNKTPKDVENLEFLLKTTGFINVEVNDSRIICTKPKYEIGSSSRLNLKKPAAVAVWKLDDDVDEEETIDPDNLLDEEDMIKPDPSSLKVCGTTGKRKACRDCSCGLADELTIEAKAGKIIDTTDAPKSSCGSCYLGDAFRCASCPYMGMPAFKPGEKIQLSDNLLIADV